MLGTIIYAIIISSIILSLYKIIFKLFDIKSNKAIKNAKNVEEAIMLRKKILSKRKKVFYCYFIIALVTCFILLLSLGLYDYDGLRFIIIFLFVLVIVLITIKHEMPKKDLYGNISYDTPDSFLDKHARFYLYLRGFDSDIPFGEEEMAKAQVFKESDFIEVVEYALGIPCCALGMTKEVDSPIGATRVYVNDDEWQEKVLELMNKAEKIFILVNNRTSCIWEIEQSVSLLNKTVFIVDDCKKYQAIRNQFINKINMPEVPNNISIPFYFENGSNAVPFNNVWDGYFDILMLDPAVIEEKKIEERKEQMLDKSTKTEKYVFWIIGIIILLFLIVYLLS